MGDELKRWRCKNGHVMGFVRRNGSGIRQLWLLREAILPNPPIGLPIGEATPPNPPIGLPIGGSEEEMLDVMAIVEGYVADVRCSICGEVRTWVPGEEAIRKLLKAGRLE